jgi:YD repeat-containing protein
MRNFLLLLVFLTLAAPTAAIGSIAPVRDLGRLAQTVSPDTGLTRYEYDAAGNVSKMKNAKGTVFTLEYNIFVSFWIVYSLSGIFYLLVSMLLDCSHRNFPTKRIKTIWFLCLLFGHLAVIPIYYFVIVHNSKSHERTV